ncbi:hypothetical protein AB0M02_14855 [Actinoplanes sp. NPDC051861]|uniref:hypothetical protein n=1 Tax=Actinoplanes sp. NPDC051861 TaxID=3155170 RepID=UPI00341BB94C
MASKTKQSAEQAPAVAETRPSDTAPAVSVRDSSAEPGGNARANADLRASAGRDQDVTGGLRWYLQLDPGGVVLAGTVLTIRLRNDVGRRGAFLRSPVARVTSRSEVVELRLQGPPADNPLLSDNGWVGFLKLRESGTVDIVVEGLPGSGGGLRYPEPPLRLSTQIGVVGAPTAEAMASDRATEARERDRLADPEASPQATGEAFRRLAVRSAIKTVNTNLAEAEALEERFTGRLTSETAQAEFEEAVLVDQQLARRETAAILEMATARQEARRAEILIPEHGVDPEREIAADLAADRAATAAADAEDLTEARGALVEAVPALGLHRLEEGQGARTGTRDQRRAGVLSRLRQVQADCRAAREALASGRLDPLDSPSTTQRLRTELGVDQDPRKRAAVDDMLRRRGADQREEAALRMTAGLLLMLVPGIGGYLSITLSGGSAVAAWMDVAEVRAAAGAGLMSAEDVSEETLEAVLATILAAVDVALSLKALKGIKMPRTRRTGRITAPRRPARPRRQFRSRGGNPREGDVIRYGDPAPGLQRHEVLSNAWLQVRGHVTKRLAGRISRDNPALALSHDVHVIVGRYQRALGLYEHANLARWDYVEVLARNAEAMHHAGIPPEIIDDVIFQAQEHAIFAIGRNLHQ